MGIVGKVRKVRTFLKKDKSFGVKLDTSMLRDGFFSNRRYFYPFDDFHKAFFVTDWDIEFKFRSLNPATAKESLKNKVFFQLMLQHSPLADKSPGLIGSIANGQYRSFSEFPTVKKIFEFKESVFLKPVSGWGGRKVFPGKKLYGDSRYRNLYY